MNGSPIVLEPGRRKPAEGVRIDLGQPTIVFVTVCTKDRVPWLACEEAHRLLVRVWCQAEAWWVGYYLLMPDHLHLFAAPRDLRFTVERWLTYWKSQFSKAQARADWRCRRWRFIDGCDGRRAMPRSGITFVRTRCAPAWSPDRRRGRTKE